MKSRFLIVLVLGGLIAGGPGVAGQPAPGAGTKPAGDGRQQLLETVGFLSAAQLYQAYLNIGLIADARAEDLYDDKEANQVLTTVLALLEKLDRQLEAVGKLDLASEDRQGLERLRKIASLLRQQGSELQAWWKSDDPEHGARYEKLRKDAWQDISRLLGIKD